MALQMDLDRKPTPAEWLAGDAWFDTLMRDTIGAYREGYKQAHDEASRRFGLSTGKSGPQMKGTG